MHWLVSHRADPVANAIAKRHYTCQTPDSGQFMPPGSCIVLLHETGCAVWGVSVPLPQYVKHAWAGAWINSLFRNEGAGLSSALIREAVAATCWLIGAPPALGLITFVDASQARSRNPGYCYQQAGFRKVGHTQGGLIAYQLLPTDMPEPEPPLEAQLPLVMA